uniref:PAZ domain-containing protein n=1 Tax=Globodera pallida TaxID=36090 RepID=A0A183CMF9_GLOPA
MSVPSNVFIHRYLMHTLSISDVDRLGLEIRLRHETVREALIGKFVFAVYAKIPINFRIHDVTIESANQLRAFKNGPSVEEYFRKKNRIMLEHPQLPCLVQRGGDNHKSFFPMELMFLNQ